MKTAKPFMALKNPPILTKIINMLNMVLLFLQILNTMNLIQLINLIKNSNRFDKIRQFY